MYSDGTRSWLFISLKMKNRYLSKDDSFRQNREISQSRKLSAPKPKNGSRRDVTPAADLDRRYVESVHLVLRAIPCEPRPMSTVLHCTRVPYFTNAVLYSTVTCYYIVLHIVVHTVLCNALHCTIVWRLDRQIPYASRVLHCTVALYCVQGRVQ